MIKNEKSTIINNKLINIIFDFDEIVSVVKDNRIFTENDNDYSEHYMPIRIMLLEKIKEHFKTYKEYGTLKSDKKQKNTISLLSSLQSSFTIEKQDINVTSKTNQSINVYNSILDNIVKDISNTTSEHITLCLMINEKTVSNRNNDMVSSKIKYFYQSSIKAFLENNKIKKIAFKNSCDFDTLNFSYSGNFVLMNKNDNKNHYVISQNISYFLNAIASFAELFQDITKESIRSNQLLCQYYTKQTFFDNIYEEFGFQYTKNCSFKRFSEIFQYLIVF